MRYTTLVRIGSVVLGTSSQLSLSNNNDIKYDWFLSPVSKIELKEGDNATIFWSAPYFPGAGTYTIYHTNKANSIIIEVTSNNVSTQNKTYEYLSRPLNSTNITFMIRDITLDDAGYYAGGTKAEAAWSGGGVVLIVLGEST